MKDFSLFLVVLFVFLVSCADNQEGPSISPSVDLIEMEAEGGIGHIDFSSGDWSIDRVENVTGDSRIFGDIYSLQNEKINENVLLGLEGEGRLEAIWQNKGFVIVRNGQDKLEISLQENSSGEQFAFRIILTSANGQRTITVSQKASQGYEFKGIKYYVGEGDGDSLYWRVGSTLKFTVPNSQEIEIMPIGGVDVNSSFFFESDAPDAFVWLMADSVEVKLPANFQDGEIYYGQEKGTYTSYVQSGKSEYSDLKEIIAVSPGYSEFRSEFEMRHRILSYTLLLTNNRTGEDKTIEGKWVQIAPTGNYRVISVD
ncbi:hypothetical protein [Algoriphagus resistens]|uniref:hypothetical protein n=1 Tax=Algoriphagus resistens TaxID=1750590 RepID=UPI0007169263|nr:hypothetical protein [Algoriphagus resistens]